MKRNRNRNRQRNGALALLLLVPPLSCGFTDGSDPNPCNDNVPAACGDIGHCVLDTDQYLQGQFPGSQSFVVRTDNPKTVTFSFTFDNRIAAGTHLTLTSTEPDCSATATYTSQGDLFELAGPSGVVSFPIQMIEAGDHLIQFSSDSYCSYELRYQ
jgi:hypothetical protein